jgi:hypothetical protein
MTTIFVPRAFTYTTADCLTRRFREFFWPDMRRMAKIINQIHDGEPWLNFINADQQPPEGAKVDATLPLPGYDSLIAVLEILFSQDYCDKPLTRAEIETGQAISVGDVKPLIEIATGLAGLEKKSQPPA